MIIDFISSLANEFNDMLWNLHLDFNPQKKEKIQKIQDDIFLTGKAKKIVIDAYKKEFFLNPRR